MAKPFSLDLRLRLVAAVLSGRSRHEVARAFSVSVSCVVKLMQRFAATGEFSPRKFGGHKQPLLAEHEDEAPARVAARPDMTVTEIWRELTALADQGRKILGRTLPQALAPDGVDGLSSTAS